MQSWLLPQVQLKKPGILLSCSEFHHTFLCSAEVNEKSDTMLLVRNRSTSKVHKISETQHRLYTSTFVLPGVPHSIYVQKDSVVTEIVRICNSVNVWNCKKLQHFTSLSIYIFVCLKVILKNQLMKCLFVEMNKYNSI